MLRVDRLQLRADKGLSDLASLVRWNTGGETSLHALQALAPFCEFDNKTLARMLNVSQRHLQRMFSAAFSCSPQAWLNERRLHVAWQMLQTSTSVKEVAYSLGFRRASQFSRDFRRRFGLTPSETAKRARSGVDGVAEVARRELSISIDGSNRPRRTIGVAR